MKPDPEKIQEIQDTPTPENKKTSQTFLGLTNYMKRFIHVYSTQTYHLRELLKGTKVTYGQKHIGVLLVVKVVFPILKTIKIHFFYTNASLWNFVDSFAEIEKPRKL